ncbi:malonate decarboxylase holo-ACP synthase [Pararobbsia silviterrae]|nr:malonate decarboxylase holo-ACP synthase [Pararobbsia silviterrae]
MSTLPLIRPIHPIRPHDLLWMADARDLIVDAPAPAWVTSAWLVQAPVVVRREDTGDSERLPVGVRGMTRAERLAGYLPLSRVVRRVTPENVVEGSASILSTLDANLPCLQAFEQVRARLDGLGFAWGVTGSAGFALATGIRVLRDTSDLDVLIRIPSRPADDVLDACAHACADAPARIDAQIDTGFGGFALLEWRARRGRVLLKTARGPVLVEDPWRPARVEPAQTDAAHR